MFPLSNYRISLCKVFFRFFAFLLCVNYVTVSLKICLLFCFFLSFDVEEVLQHTYFTFVQFQFCSIDSYILKTPSCVQEKSDVVMIPLGNWDTCISAHGCFFFFSIFSLCQSKFGCECQSAKSQQLCYDALYLLQHYSRL